MGMSLQKIEALIREFRRIGWRSPEPNIFAVGARGYYESPTNDLLAFFGDCSKPHGLGELVLGALLESAGIDDSLASEDVKPPEREVWTDNDKRIDMIFEGESWVAAVETKVHHSEHNPFSEYERYLRNHYPEKDLHLFLLLTPLAVGRAPRGWKRGSFRQFRDAAERRLGSRITNARFDKWIVIFREFLLHLRDETERGGATLTETQIQWMEENLAAIDELSKFTQGFFDTVMAHTRDAVGASLDCRVRTKQDSWPGPKMAIRHYPESWQWTGKSNVALVIDRSDGVTGYGIKLYAYGIPDEVETSRADIPPKYDLEYDTEANGRIRVWTNSHRKLARSEAIQLLAETAPELGRILEEKCRK